jgi:hypothetical protein
VRAYSIAWRRNFTLWSRPENRAPVTPSAKRRGERNDAGTISKGKVRLKGKGNSPSGEEAYQSGKQQPDQRWEGETRAGRFPLIKAPSVEPNRLGSQSDEFPFIKPFPFLIPERPA